MKHLCITVVLAAIVTQFAFAGIEMGTPFTDSAHGSIARNLAISFASRVV